MDVQSSYSQSTLLYKKNPVHSVCQPRSQGSLLPALRTRRAGRREPWGRGCQYVCSFTFKASYSSNLCTDPPSLHKKSDFFLGEGGLYTG